MTRSPRSPLVLALVALSLAAGPSFAQTPPPAPAPAPEGTVEKARAWTDTADLSVIITTGNSEGTNFAFSNKFVYKWTQSEFTFDIALLRTETTEFDQENVDGVLVETEEKDLSAETYSANGKYRYIVHEGLFWYVGAGWLRNRPSGIENREYGGAGMGYRFIKTDKDVLLGELGADYTYEEDVDSPDPTKGFTNAREFVSWEHFFSDSAKFSTELEALENLEDSDDYRIKSVTAIVASFTKKLALKVSYTVLYDHQPVVDVLQDPPFPDVFFENETTDTVFSAALVVNF